MLPGRNPADLGMPRRALYKHRREPCDVGSTLIYLLAYFFQSPDSRLIVAAISYLGLEVQLHPRPAVVSHRYPGISLPTRWAAQRRLPKRLASSLISSIVQTSSTHGVPKVHSTRCPSQEHRAVKSGTTQGSDTSTSPVSLCIPTSGMATPRSLLLSKSKRRHWQR